MKLLLVDDDAEIRFIATYVLREAGYDIVEAGDGAEAARALAAHQPDVLLMDLMLGTDDGVDVAERLRADAPAHMRVVYLTGASRPEQLARLHDAGAAGVLTKPFDPTRLAADLSAILSG